MAAAADHKVLYSTNTWLAYMIAERYYGRHHYVWCTPYFDPASVPDIDYAVPPSSSPSEIYLGLLEDVRRGDRHSAKIGANKTGLLRGAEQKRAAGLITDSQLADIVAIVNAAEIKDFFPLIFVIPFSMVRDTLMDVPVSQRANAFSVEYIVEKLPRASFDVLRLDRRP